MRAALLLALALLTSCMTVNDPQADFHRFEDQYFDELFAYSPSSGVNVGLHQYDNDVEDLSEASFRKRIAQLRALAARLSTIPQEQLADAQQIDYEILDSQIKAELQDLIELQTWRRNPMAYAAAPGNAIDVIMKRKFAPPQQRLRSAVARLHGIPAMLEAMKENVMDPAREFTDLAIRIAEGSVGFFRNDIAKWGRASAGSDFVLLSQFEVANEQAAKALEDAVAWLKSDLLKRSTGAYAIGADAFSKKLRYTEMVDGDLQETLALGERNLEKDYQEFVETARRINAQKTPASVMASLADNHPSASELIPAFQSTVESIRKFLIDKNLVTIPSDVRPTIVETPPYMRNGLFAAMDTPGAYEKVATEAYYYVTPTEKDWPPRQVEEHLRLFNRSVIEIVTIHEAYPGHYVQFLYAPQFATKTRKLVSVASNSEGWAHYAEQMMIEEGFGGGDLRYRLAQLSEALLRDCRYVAGIRMHTDGWTVERATRLFMKKGFQERASAFEEARRGTYDPTYLVYTLGKLEIYKLRNDYKAANGSSYSLKTFHNTFLQQGAIPLKLVRRMMMGVH